MSQKPSMTWKVGAAVLLSIATIVVVLVCAAFVFRDMPREIGLPILAITGIVLLLGTLAIVAITFSLFGIDDPKQALGLPDGSIRAAIALSLIVLFGIFAVYFYSSLSDRTPDQVTSIEGLSTESANAFKTNLANGRFLADVMKEVTKDGKTVETHKIFFKSGPDPASVDFAKQLMTLMGTLVTAIASFYFGSKAAAPQAAPTPAPSASPTGGGPPTLSGIAPTSPSGGGGGAPLTLTLTGTNLGDVSKVTLRNAGGALITAVNLSPTPTQVTFDVAIPQSTPPGKWDVIASSRGVDYTLSNAFTTP